MLRRRLLVLAAAICAATPLLADLPRTLEGSYHWEPGRHRGELEATFTPSGENHWDVAFQFTFSGRSHTYRGTATGSLDNGSLAGEVRTEDGRRRFAFRGTVDEGTFSGTHSERYGEDEEHTGTLTLRP
jgi:hypothetical protein